MTQLIPSFVFSLINVQTFLVFLTAFLLISYLFRVKDGRKLAPGPPSLPVIGTMLIFAIKMRTYLSPFRVMHAWREEYGDIFRMKFGPQEAVVISGYKLVTEGLRKHKHVFGSRPYIHSFQSIAKGCGIASSNGKIWSETQKFASGALREMGVGKKSLEVHLQEEAEFLIDVMEAEKRPFHPRDLLLKAAANIVLRICFGERCDYEDPEFCELIKNLDIGFKTIGAGLLEDFWPWIEYFPPLARLPLLKSTNVVIEGFVMRRVLEHNESYDAHHIRDLTDLHIKRRQTWKDEDIRTNFHMCRTITDLIAAGTDTSVTNISWLFLHMIRYPDIQLKCQSEIRKVVGSGRKVSLDDKPQLVYNMAVMNEVQRHCTFGVPRGVSRDIEIGGHLVPKDAIAIFNLDSVHRDQTQWGPDADEFKPERWIDEQGQLRTFDAFMPFSLGTRKCLGEPLARMEDFLFFTNAIQRLTFRTPVATEKPDMDGLQLGIVQLPKEYNLIAEMRH